MNAISEYWLTRAEMKYGDTTGQLSEAATIKPLLAEVRRLQDENAKLKGQVSRLNSYGSAEIRRLTKERNEARAERELAKAEVVALNDDIKGLKREIETIQEHQKLTDLDMQVILGGMP